MPRVSNAQRGALSVAVAAMLLSAAWGLYTAWKVRELEGGKVSVWELDHRLRDGLSDLDKALDRLQLAHEELVGKLGALERDVDAEMSSLRRDVAQLRTAVDPTSLDLFPRSRR